MANVGDSAHTPHGIGRIIDVSSVRGHTSYRVAGSGFNVWIDQTKLHVAADGKNTPPQLFDDDADFGPVNKGNSTTLPYSHGPQYSVDMFRHQQTVLPGDQPIDADERLSPSDSLTGESRKPNRPYPGPNPDLFAKSAGLDDYLEDHVRADSDDEYDPDDDGDDDYDPDDDDDDDLESDEGDFSGDDDYEGHLTHDARRYYGGDGYDDGRDADEPEDSQVVYDHDDDDHDTHHQDDFDDRYHDGAGYHEGRSRFAEFDEPGRNLDPDCRPDQGDGQWYDDIEGAVDPTPMNEDRVGRRRYAPGRALNDMTRMRQMITDPVGSRLHHLLTGERVAGLSSRYAKIPQAYRVSEFAADPQGFLERKAHQWLYGQDAHLEHQFGDYANLIEADRNLRTAAWRDVRKKAMRLRRDGKVRVREVGPSGIYASVVGDHGTYEVVILKGGSKDMTSASHGQSISSWACSCDWGRWAFKRKISYVGRLCSHGYATYLDMQSEHGRQRGNPFRHGSITDEFKTWADDNNDGCYDIDSIADFLDSCDHDVDGDDVQKLYDHVADHPDEVPERDFKLKEYTFDNDKAYKQGSKKREADVLRTRPQSLSPTMRQEADDEGNDDFVDPTVDERETTGPSQIMSAQRRASILLHGVDTMGDNGLDQEAHADTAAVSTPAPNTGGTGGISAMTASLHTAENPFSEFAHGVGGVAGGIGRAFGEPTEWALGRIPAAGAGIAHFIQDHANPGSLAGGSVPRNPATPGTTPAKTVGNPAPAGGLAPDFYKQWYPQAPAAGGAATPAKGAVQGPPLPGQTSPAKTVSDDKPAVPAPAGGPMKADENGNFTVRPGDTLSGIAKGLGISDYHDIINQNRGKIGDQGTNIEQNADLIHPGDVFNVKELGKTPGSGQEDIPAEGPGSEKGTSADFGKPGMPAAEPPATGAATPAKPADQTLHPTDLGGLLHGGSRRHADAHDDELLDRLRDLSTAPPAYHHMDERNDEVRDISEELNDRGYDAGPIVAALRYAESPGDGLANFDGQSQADWGDQPFAGSGPDPKTFFGDSAAYVDRHERPHFDDVTDLDYHDTQADDHLNSPRGPRHETPPVRNGRRRAASRRHGLGGTVGDFGGPQAGPTDLNAATNGLSAAEGPVTGFGNENRPYADPHYFGGGGPDMLATPEYTASLHYADVENDDDEDDEDMETYGGGEDGGEPREGRRVRRAGRGSRSRVRIDPGVRGGGRQQRHALSADDDFGYDGDNQSGLATFSGDAGASAMGTDVTAAFQRSAAASDLMGSAPSGGGDWDIAGAAQGFLRTAGRKFSLEEQRELEREEHPLGARNKPSREDLMGTHYL